IPESMLEVAPLLLYVLVELRDRMQDWLQYANRLGCCVQSEPHDAVAQQHVVALVLLVPAGDTIAECGIIGLTTVVVARERALDSADIAQHHRSQVELPVT